MNKILRYSFIAALALTCNAGFAQTYIWQEDFGNYEADDVPTGGTYGYVCTNGKGNTKVYDASLAGGEAPEILVGKTGGSFSTTLKMNGASGDMTLAFKSNKTLNVTAENATVGEVTKSGNDFSCPITVAEGTDEITLTFTMPTSQNARLDNIKLYQGEAKKAAGLSWGTASRSVKMGSESNTFPSLTNANSLDVTYSSSNPEVATISATGEITLVAAGTTTITASFAGNDDYEAGEVSYTLTVEAASTDTETETDITNTPETAYSVAKAKELIAAGEGLDNKVYVQGIISQIKEVSTKYGNATYYISADGTTADQLMVYRGYNLGGEKFTAEDQIKVGDAVIVYGKLVNYNGTSEFTTGNQIYSLNSVTTGISVDASIEETDTPLFNLSGQKVSASYKGIVVKGGKKYILK